jgi:hypothetical protein
MRENIFVFIFWRAGVCWTLHCLWRRFVFLRDVCNRTQRAAVASMRATNFATHLLKKILKEDNIKRRENIRSVT